jgi:hypothetical protein
MPGAAGGDMPAEQAKERLRQRVSLADCRRARGKQE